MVQGLLGPPAKLRPAAGKKNGPSAQQRKCAKESRVECNEETSEENRLEGKHPLM